MTRSGRYRDTVECRPGEEIVGDTSHSLKVCRVGSYRKLLDISFIYPSTRRDSVCTALVLQERPVG